MVDATIPLQWTMFLYQTYALAYVKNPKPNQVFYNRPSVRNMTAAGRKRRESKNHGYLHTLQISLHSALVIFTGNLSDNKHLQRSSVDKSGSIQSTPTYTTSFWVCEHEVIG